MHCHVGLHRSYERQKMRYLLRRGLLDHGRIQTLLISHYPFPLQYPLTKACKNILTLRSFSSARDGGVLLLRAPCTVCRIFSLSVATRFVCSSSGALTARLPWLVRHCEATRGDSRRSQPPHFRLSSLHLQPISLVHRVPAEQIRARTKCRFLGHGRREQLRKAGQNCLQEVGKGPLPMLDFRGVGSRRRVGVRCVRLRDADESLGFRQEGGEQRNTRLKCKLTSSSSIAQILTLVDATAFRSGIR